MSLAHQFLLCFSFILLSGLSDSFQVPKCSTTTTTTTRTRNHRQRQHESTIVALPMVAWSDSKAVREYQDFLASGKQELELAEDGPSIIIRPANGRQDLADILQNMGMGDDMVLSPEYALPETVGGQSEYPIYITLPPYQIDDFLLNLDESYQNKAEDFVFISGGLQYGNMEDVLKERGFCRDSMTQFLISGMKMLPSGWVEDISMDLGLGGNGEPQIAGECSACGKWAGAISKRLERNNIRCRTEFYREWRRRMWERCMGDAVFHLIGCVRNEPTTVAQVATYYGAEVSDMMWEMSQLLRGWKALTLTFGFEDRLFSVAEASATDEQCVLIDEMFPYIWGNSLFLQGQMFVTYLNYAQTEKMLLRGIELPPVSKDDEVLSNMRQGIFRADGTV